MSSTVAIAAHRASREALETRAVSVAASGSGIGGVWSMRAPEGRRSAAGGAESLRQDRAAGGGYRGVATTNTTITEPGGASGLLVTQDFIEVAGPLDVARAAATVLDRVNARRASHHAPPFARDPALDAIAARAAQGYYAHPERPQESVMTEVGDVCAT